MIAFSVAPTETEGKFILLPFKPLGAEACIYPFLIFILAPSFFNAKRWRSTGLVPMAQPPGKEIFAFNDRSGTRWKFCLIPLGGYVKFFGDRNVFSRAEQDELLRKYTKEDQNKLFVTKPLYQRSLVVAAGPFANFVLAILIFSFIYMFAGKDFTPAEIQEVQKDSPAYSSGIKSGDVILSINNKKVSSILDVSTYINTSTTENIDVKVFRNSKEITLKVKPKIIQTQDSLGNQVNKKILAKLGQNVVAGESLLASN